MVGRVSGLPSSVSNATEAWIRLASVAAACRAPRSAGKRGLSTYGWDSVLRHHQARSINGALCKQLTSLGR
jgi:hypothetical protein